MICQAFENPFPPGKGFFQTVKEPNVLQNEKPPLLKGGGRAKARSEGFAVEFLVFALVFGKFVTFCCESPSHGFAVPAPFDKGAFESYFFFQIKSSFALMPRVLGVGTVSNWMM